MKFLRNDRSISEVFILSLPGLHLINIFWISTLYNILEEGLPLVCVLLEAKMYFFENLLEINVEFLGKM